MRWDDPALGVEWGGWGVRCVGEGMRLPVLGDVPVETVGVLVGGGSGGGWWGGGGGRRDFLHWAARKPRVSFIWRVEGPLADDMSPARVCFNAPSRKIAALFFAQQPRPNDKRNPLLLLRIGTAGLFEEASGKARRSSLWRGQNAEVRSERQPKGRQAGHGAGGRGQRRATEGGKGARQGRGGAQP